MHSFGPETDKFFIFFSDEFLNYLFWKTDQQVLQNRSKQAGRSQVLQFTREGTSKLSLTYFHDVSQLRPS